MSSRPRLVVASGNEHKVREFERLLDGSFEVLGLSALHVPSGQPWPGDVAEDGDSFEANAAIKALAAARWTELPVLADDSGLCVDALKGRPGIHSARYGGEGLSDQQRYELLLAETDGVSADARGAHYRAAIVLARGGQVLRTEVADCFGRLLTAPQGAGGFGYDPIFHVPEHDCSMAELSPQQKDALSHRARALRAIHASIPQDG
jgi:XTP/dITP diphosphohydrolase